MLTPAVLSTINSCTWVLPVMVWATLPFITTTPLPATMALVPLPPTQFLHTPRLTPLRVSCAPALMVTVPTPTADEMTGLLAVTGMITSTAQAFGPPTGAVGVQLVVTDQSVLVVPVHW